jgi:hypothetical protein
VEHLHSEHKTRETIVTAFRTTARISLASLAFVFGANLAAAKDKTPAKPDPKQHAAPAAKHAAPSVQPHTPPSSTEKRQHKPLHEAKPPVAAQVQGHKLDKAKKPNGWKWGETQTDKVKDAARSAPEVNKQDGFTYQKIESVKSPRDAASGQATGKTTPPTANKPGNIPAVGMTKGTATVKPGVSVTKPTVRNDSGTRTGGSLVVNGIANIATGVGKFMSGKPDDAFKLWDHGIKQVQTGSNGDPADNGPKLNPDEKTEGEGKGEGEGEGGGSSGSGTGSGSGSGSGK